MALLNLESMIFPTSRLVGYVNSLEGIFNWQKVLILHPPWLRRLFFRFFSFRPFSCPQHHSSQEKIRLLASRPQRPKPSRLRLRSTTLPETNIAPENRPSRRLVFQPSIFRGYVCFREGNLNLFIRFFSAFKRWWIAVIFQQIKMEKAVSLVEHVGHKELSTAFFSRVRESMGLVHCASCILYAFLLDDERKIPSMAPMAFLPCLLPLSWRWSFSLLVIFLTIFASLKTPTWLEHMTNFNHLNLHLMKLFDLSYLNDMLIFWYGTCFQVLYWTTKTYVFLFGCTYTTSQPPWMTSNQKIQSDKSEASHLLLGIAIHQSPCFHLTRVFCWASLFQQTKNSNKSSVYSDWYTWVHMVWLPKIKGETKTSSLCGYSILLNRSHPWGTANHFFLPPTIMVPRNMAFCKGNRFWGNPFPTSRMMGERAIRLAYFSEYQGEVSFDLQITDLNSLEYRQTAGQNATKKNSCHWGWPTINCWIPMVNLL